MVPLEEKDNQIYMSVFICLIVALYDESNKWRFHIHAVLGGWVWNANYIYRYGDRKATLERKTRSKELFDVVKSFAEVPAVNEQINWIECFKFALEQYGIENANNFLIQNDLQTQMS